MNRKLKLSELNRRSVEEFRALPKQPVIVVLDNIRSHHNVGSIFRTADAFAFEAVYLCGYTPAPPHREIHKTALGATESVSWKKFDTTVDAVQELKKNGYAIISIEQTENKIMLDAFKKDPGKKYALVFGNEVEGVEQAVVDASDTVIELPQLGTKHSLNISICAGIVMWEFFKTP
ncbi:MAG TPA: RNA methyltransferase [Flavobacteriales bacterium]|nr:RNA methyltransferase [Flavobacteriales bacterium]